MLDQYWHGTSSRLSPEAPVPVVKVGKTDNRLGGAANVANNLDALGCESKLLGVIGKDQAGEIIQHLLQAQNINNELLSVDSFSSIVKLRVLCQQQQMIRLDHEDDVAQLDQNSLKCLHDLFASQVANYQAVVLSDYAKGVLLDPQPYIKIANILGIPTIVDPKNTNFKVYSGADIVKPNLAEFQAIVGKCDNLVVLEEKARNLMQDCGVKNLVITRGVHGISVIPNNDMAVHLPAQGREIYDVTGAGDTVISVLAAALVKGFALPQAAYLSTIAAGIVVGKLGTSNVSTQEIIQELGNQRNIESGIMDEEHLRQVIKFSQARGEKVVFVNGCYDVLHYGHIRYLSRARAFGDRLVVGVNTDRSIKCLKGESRPIFKLQYRMEVLAALKDVDWVVSFDETTPGRLVESLSPDIIVKTDEKFKSIDQIPDSEGVQHVLQHGGQVHIIPMTQGSSSSKIIEYFL